MGSWNETCFITQLPITYGDKIRAFAITENSKMRGGGICYPNDAWYPIGPAVKGIYGDYGRIYKIEDNIESQLLLKTIKSKIINPEDHIDDVRFDIDDVNINNCSLEDYFHLIERDGATVRNFVGKEKILGQVFLLEEVYQAMSTYDFISYYRFEINNQQETLYKPYSEIFFLQMKEWFDKLSQAYKNENMIELSLAMTDRVINDSDIKGIDPFSNAIIKLAKENLSFEDKRVQELLNPMLREALFCFSMKTMRKLWMPQAGKGSQGHELDLYKKINKVTNKIMFDRIKEDRREGVYSPNKEGYTSYMLEHNAEVLKKIEENGNKKE